MTPDQLLGWALRNDAAVDALIDERVYPLVIPQDATRPAIAYQQISGPVTYSHSGPTLESVRFQLTLEGRTYGEAVQLATAVRSALERNGWMQANAQDGYAQGLAIPVKRLDFILNV